MPSLLESLTSNLGDAELGTLTELLGTDREHAQSAVPAGIATLLGGLAANASSTSGAEALSSALGNDHDGGILDDIAGFLGGGGQADAGAKILGHIMGDRQASMQNSLSESTGLDAGKIGTLLATLAPMVMAQLGKAQRQGGLDANGLAGLLGQEREQIRQQPPSNLGALSALLDQDGDGSVLDDLAESGGSLLGSLLKSR